jgi:chaperonin cofactor prefoldin
MCHDYRAHLTREQKAEMLSKHKQNLEKRVKELDDRIKELEKTPVAAVPQSA